MEYGKRVGLCQIHIPLWKALFSKTGLQFLLGLKKQFYCGHSSSTAPTHCIFSNSNNIEEKIETCSFMFFFQLLKLFFLCKTQIRFPLGSTRVLLLHTDIVLRESVTQISVGRKAALSEMIKNVWVCIISRTVVMVFQKALKSAIGTKNKKLVFILTSKMSFLKLYILLSKRAIKK